MKFCKEHSDSDECEMRNAEDNHNALYICCLIVCAVLIALTVFLLMECKRQNERLDVIESQVKAEQIKLKRDPVREEK